MPSYHYVAYHPPTASRLEGVLNSVNRLGRDECVALVRRIAARAVEPPVPEAKIEVISIQRV